MIYRNYINPRLRPFFRGEKSDLRFMCPKGEKIKVKQHLISQVLFTCLLVLLATGARADKVFKKDGTVVEGRIILRTDEKIFMESGPSLVKINIPIEEVERIEQVSATALPKILRGTFQEGEKALNEGRPVDALGKFLEVVEGLDQPSQQILQNLTSAMNRSLRKAAENAQNPQTRLEAVRQYEALRQYIRRDGFKYLVRTNSQWAHIAPELNEKLALAYYYQAIEDTRKGDPSMHLRIEKFLKGALELTPPDDKRYIQMVESLGQFQFRYLKQYDQAIATFHQIYDNTTDDEIKKRFYDLLNQARNAKIEDKSRDLPPIATPTPFSAEDIARLNPPPEKPPEYQDKVEKEKEPPFFKRFSDLVMNKKYKEAAGHLWKGIRDNAGVIPLILMILGFIGVFWIVPILIVRARSRRADMLATKLLLAVKITGIIGLLVYLLALVFKWVFQKGPKERCPYCKKPLDNIEAYTDYNFRICPHCHENIDPVYSLEDYIFHLVETVQAGAGKKAGYRGATEILEKDAMLKLIRGIITLAFRRRASDLHIEPDSEGLKIRARVDGMLYEILNLPKNMNESVVSAIKVMANLDISEKRVPQDGRISIWVDKRDLDLRINTSPAAQGEKVSIRLLDPRAILVDSTKLGLDGDNLEKFERAIRKPYGLIMVTGPSGSGKSTSLYVALNTINTGDKNIVTIEDPIEYTLEGINQQQVCTAANFTFATGLRSILRQDPDVIMVGEIRDRETADIAIDAATTGHTVLTTLHTIDSPTAIARLQDLGIPSRRYSSILISIIAQRLIRLNCPDCNKPYKPRKADLDMMEMSDKMGVVFMKGTGCDTCNNTGFYGRTGLFEILMPDEDMKKLLETNPSVSVIRALARKNGMRTLREEGILKVTRGLTCVEEVLRVTT